jgi:hypothetical protein
MSATFLDVKTLPYTLLIITAFKRFAVWPKVREFIDALPPGALVADVGCGNGKYFGVRRDVAVLGSDRSAGGYI